MRTEYTEGVDAALEGKEFWDNPYSEADCSRESFHMWMAGWCYGKRDYLKLLEERKQ